MRRSLIPSHVYLFALFMLGGAAACSVDVSVFQASPGGGGDAIGGQGGGGSSADGGMSSTASSGGQGGAPECEGPDDCPEETCMVGSCEMGSCVATPEAYGTECDSDKVCDGEGSCLAINGTPCGAANECLSGFCTDGVCCEKACSGECESCSRPGEEGLCRLHDVNTDPDDECIDDGVCDGAGRCASGELLSSAGFVSESNQYSYNLAVDSQDNVIIAGVFFGNVDFGGGKLYNEGGYDYFIAKFDKMGKHVFSKQFKSSGQNQGSSFALAVGANDAIIIGGYFTGTIEIDGQFISSVSSYDAIMVALDSSGSHMWNKVYGGGGDQRVVTVATDSTGNIYAGGRFSTSINFDGNNLVAESVDGFLTKFDKDGAVQWANKYGLDGNEYVWAVQTDPQDNVIVGGYYYQSIDFGFGVESSKDNADVFVLRVAPDGKSLLAKSFGGPGYDSLRGMAVDSAGRVVLSGTFSGTFEADKDVLTAEQNYDQYLVSLDDQFEVRWAEQLQSTNEWWAGSPVATDANGNVVVARTFANDIMDDGMSYGPSGSDILVTKYGNDGTRLWNHLIGGPGEDQLRYLQTNSAGEIWITGYFSEDIDFGGAKLTSTSGYDVFIASMSP